MAGITLAGMILRRVKKFGSWMGGAIFRCRRQLWETAWRTLRAATDAGAQCEEFASMRRETSHPKTCRRQIVPLPGCSPEKATTCKRQYWLATNSLVARTGAS